MLASRRFRLSALLAGAAVVAASVLPAFPAAAEEPPAPDPIVTSEPVADPTPEVTPTEEPTPEATPTAEPTTEAVPTAEPTPPSTPNETPTATPAPDAAGTVSYSGTAQQTSDDGIAIDEDVVLFAVSGLGYLSVDVSTLATKPDALNPVLMTMKVPVSLTLSDDADVRFSQLATASAAKPLVAVSAKKSKQTTTQATAQLVNQTPSTGATHHVFAVYVSPVNKKVKSPSQANITAAQTLVAYADTYWSAQSNGSIHFALDGVVPWYQSTYSCATQPGSASLWTQALAKAKTAGYVPGRNNHLVLLFPDGFASNYGYCGGAIGLGTVGGSVNQGGQVWVMGDGNTAPGHTLDIAKETIAHELGHNMSLGHADWLGCAAANPNVGVSNAIYGSDPGISGCDVYYYGDTTDVMGFGIGDGASGALSSPQAIRAGIWPTSKWTTPGIGLNQTYTLLPVADHSGVAGWHSLVVQDTDGTAYFVELRNFQNEDATNFIGCDNPALPNPQVCTLGVPHVRILRFEPSGYSGYPGADTYLIGRSNVNVGYTSGALGTYTLPGGDSIQVTAVSATQATVKVSRVAPGSPTTSSADWVNLARTVGYDSSLRVGDTMSLFLGDFWNQETYTFTWYRNGVVIPGANSQNYTLVAADLGTKINASVTPAGQPAVFDTDDSTPAPALPGGYGPIAVGIYQASDPGTVSVSAALTPLAGTVSSWPSGTTFAFQWLRGATATTATTPATGITSSASNSTDYTPNAADWNQFLRLKVTATVPGYNSVVRYSTPAKNYSLYTQVPVPPTFAITGTPKIGTEVSVNTADLAFFDVGGSSVSGVTLAYQWLRNGVPISDTFPATIDATDDNDYTLLSGDFNASVTLRVTASKPGFVDRVFSTPVFKPTQLGTIQGSYAVPTMTKAVGASNFTLTATMTGGAITEAGTTLGYQWYRVNRTTSVATAIVGAVSQTYTPVAADYAYKLRVRIIVKKLNYTTVNLDAVAKDYSLRLAPATTLGFAGAVAVQTDQTLLASTNAYNVEDDATTNTLTLGSATLGLVETDTWYHSGVKVAPTFTGFSYLLVAAEVGQTMSYRMDATYPGYLPIVQLSSTSTVPVALAPLSTGGTAPSISGPSASLVLTVTRDVGDVNPAATSTPGVQWFRNGVAVAGQVGVTYQLTAADFGKAITAKVTYKRAGYSNKVLDATFMGTGIYSVLGTAPSIGGLQKINSTLTATLGTYRNGTDGSIITPGVSDVTYQWLRNGVAIVGQTSDTYTPTAPADTAKAISVRVTVTQPNLLQNVQTTAATLPLGTDIITGATPTAVTPVIEPTPASTIFTQVLGLDAAGTGLTTPIVGVPNIVAYQWFRDGVAITGATKATYTLTQTDRGHNVWLRVTTSHAASAGHTYTTVVQTSNKLNLTLISLGGADIFPQTNYQVGAELDVVVPAFTDAQGTAVDTLTVSQTFQWYRTLRVKVKGVYKYVTTAIPAAQGGTNSFYFLKLADLGGTITVKVTTGKAGFISHIATYTTTPATQKVLIGTLVNASTSPIVTMDVPATNTLKATPPDVQGQPQFPSINTQHATFTYQWYRDNPLDVTPPAAIPAATAQTYKLTSLDYVRNVFVKVTANLAGYTSVTLPLSTPIDYSITLDGNPSHVPYESGGSWTVGTSIGLYGYTIVKNKDEDPVSSPSFAFQWLRAGVVIPGEITDSYQLTTADYNKKITVRLTVSKPGYIPMVSVIDTGVVIGKGVTVLETGVVGDPDYFPGPTVSVVPGAGLGTLLAQINDVSPSVPAPVYAYRWYRSTTNASARVLIAGATAATYKLTAADFGKFISLQVTMSRTNFTVPVMVLPISNIDPFTPRVDYSIQGAGAAGLTPTAGVHVGDTLTATPPTFLEADNVTTLGGSPDITYTWYRSGVAIAGQTADVYTLTGADLGKIITVKATASLPGRLARTSLASPATAAVAIGTIQPGTYHPVVTMPNPANGIVVANFAGTPTVPASGGFTMTYKWYREGVVAPISTAMSYKLVAADTGKSVSVVVTIAKPGFATYTGFAAVQANAIIPAEALVAQVNGANVTTAAFGNTLNAAPPFYYLQEQYPSGTEIDDAFRTLQWYIDGAPIAGETGFYYVVRATDSGHLINVKVTVTSPLHKTLVDPSNVITIS